jgi:hypothetical protein
MWLRTSFSDDPNVVSEVRQRFNRSYRSPTLVSGLIQGPTTSGLTRFSIIQGSLVINNSSGAVKRYKYIAGDNVSWRSTDSRQLISRDLEELE